MSRPRFLKLAPSAKRCKIVLLLALMLSVTAPGISFAQTEPEETPRPRTEELLPETTVLFIEIANIREFIEKARESNGAKLIQDESIAPLAQEVWDSAHATFDEFASDEEFPFTLEQLRSLPGGEINIAMIAPKRKNPVFLFTFEYDEENENFTKLLDFAREKAEEEGAELESEMVDEVEINRVGKGDEMAYYFQKDGLLVGSNSETELKAYLDRWMGREVEKIRPLSKNRKFVTIMNRCRGTNDLQPDMRMYADPIELARASMRGNAGAQMALNFLPVVGLDGLLAVGGSVIMFEDEFESVTHGHVLLASPRKGVFSMIALKPSSYQPDNWIPADAVNYISTSWDAKKMYLELSKMIDTFQGEDATRNAIQENVNDELDLDFEEDILGSLTGRVTLAQFVAEDVPWLVAQKSVVAIELTEDNKADEVIQKIMDRIKQDMDEDDPERLIEVDYKGLKYWKVAIDEARQARRRERMERRRAEGEVAFDMEIPQPCFGRIDRHILVCFTGDPALMERCIDTYRGQEPTLKDDKEFRRIASKINRLAGSDMPCALMYSKPEDAMRNMFNMAKDEDIMNVVRMGRDQKYAGRFVKAIEENPLPEYDDVKKYFTPSGGFILNDETGYHFLFFQTRMEEDK